MAVAKKYKRRLTIGNRLFWWYIKEDHSYGFAGALVLSVLSDDKKLILRYAIDADEGKRHVVVEGPEFGADQDYKGSWRRYRCPEFLDRPNAVGPSHVRALIEWALTERTGLVSVTWQEL